MKHTLSAAVFAAATALGAIAASAAEPGSPLAKVNGHEITNAELRFAEAEIGSQLSGPPETRRAQLVEYLIQAHVLAQAAEKAQFPNDDLEQRKKYYQTRALRDAYMAFQVKDIETKLAAKVTDAEAKTYYDDRVKSVPTTQEISARHILVKTEDEAKNISKEVAGGLDFAKAAAKYSQDLGVDGEGRLQYFGRGEMVKPFEDAAFALEKGKVSDPVQTQFGWHLIKVEDKRETRPPSYEEVKEQITASLVRNKLLEELDTNTQKLRDSAKIEIIDPEVKKAMDAEAATDTAKPEEKK